jgi:hypothetical protein
MLHARADYNRIQDPENKIPANEPVFLLRAQDVDAAWIVRAYGLAQKAKGKLAIAALCEAHAKLMEAWPTKKEADL